MKKFVVSFFSALLLALSFISVFPVCADYPAETAETIREYYSEALAVHRDEAVKILKDKFSSEGYDLSNYHYIIVESYRNQFIAQYDLICLDFSSLNFTDYYYPFKSSSPQFTPIFNVQAWFNWDDFKFSNISFLAGSSTFYYHLYDYSNPLDYGFQFIESNIPVTNNNTPVSMTGKPVFLSPVSAKFDFKSDIEFFCCLNGNATALPVDNRVWIEVYDTLVAVETLVYKPYKYVYTNTITSSSPDVPNKHEQVICDYLLANSVGPYYSISVDTLLHAGCKTDYFYTARAFVYNGSEPYEIANLTFQISSEGISTVDPSLKDPDNPDDPIMKTWNNDNRTYNYYNVNTGAQVDKDKLVYKFDFSVDPSVNGSGQDISDFDFNSDFSTDLTQGAGLVRTLFDKIIQSAGLSGFMITVLSVAVVGWFIFGSRR